MKPWPFCLRRVLPAVSLAGLFILYLAYSLSRYDLDFGWHLRAGQYILAHGIPAHDVFSYTAQSFPWIDHEWLNDVLMATLYRSGGYPLVAILFAAVWSGALWLASRRHGALMWLGAIATLPFAGVRTVTWTVLFLVLLNKLLNGRRYWLLAPLFCLWANLHGSFVLGLVLLLLELGLHRDRRFILPALAAAAATFINPYGPSLYVEIFRTLLDTRLHSVIQEWEPLQFPWQIWEFCALGIAISIVYRPQWLNRQTSWALFLGAMALGSTRHTPLFVVAALPVFEQAADHLIQDFRQTRLGSRLLWPGLAILLVFIPLAAEGAQGNFNLQADRGQPAATVTYLRQHPCSGNTFNTYNQGGYLLWKLGRPDYIDGRMPSWRWDDTGAIDQYWQFISDAKVRARQERRFNIRCAVLPDGKVVAGNKAYDLAASLQREGWRKVLSDPNGNVWVR